MTDSAKYSILYVEDDPGLAMLMSKRLEKAGHRVEVAMDGVEGLNRIREKDFDLILLDQVLPGMDGLDVIRSLQESEHHPATVMVTGSGDERTAVQAMKLGANDYIVKDPQGNYLELIETVIERAIAQRRIVLEKLAAQEALKRERDLAQRYLDIASVIIVAVGADQRVKLINRKGLQTLGRTEKEIIGHNWIDVAIPLSYRESTRAAFLELVQAGGTNIHELFPSGLRRPVISSSGEERLIEWHNSVLTDEEGRFAGTLSSGTDITERHRAESALLQQALEDASIAELSNAILARDISYQEISNLVLEHARELASSPSGCVGSIDPATGNLLIASATPDLASRFEQEGASVRLIDFGCIWGWSLLHREPLIANSPEEDPRLKEESARRGAIQRFLSAPAIAGDNLVGLIALANSARPYSNQNLRSVSRLANFYAIAIRQMRARQALEESEKRFRVLAEGAQDVIYRLEIGPSRRFSFVSPSIEKVTGYTPKDFYADPGILSKIVHPEDTAKGKTPAPGTGAPEKPVVLRWIRKDTGIVWIEQQVVGIHDEDGNLVALEAICRDVTARKEEENRLQFEARHDPLTGLANRAQLLERLNLVFRHFLQEPGHHFAVLFVDLDEFKAVNDTLGHQAGDELLVRVGQRIQSCVRPLDLVARLGGDEFAILMERVPDVGAALAVGRRIREALDRPFELSQGNAKVSGSIGLAHSSAEAKSVDEIVHKADIAMYKAKQAGKNRIIVFESEDFQETQDLT